MEGSGDAHIAGDWSEEEIQQDFEKLCAMTLHTVGL